MCKLGGDDKKTTTTNQTSSTDYTPNPTVANAATNNINYAQNLQSAGFTPYTGQRVADFQPLQDQAFAQAGSSQIPDLISAYATHPAGNVTTGSIADNMSPYMSQYVNDSLTPQLRLQQQQFDAQNKADDSAATSSGAYGDARAGIQTSNTREAQDAQRSGLIAQAYNNAFNTAIGAGAQDVANQNQTQTTNANLQEQALARAVGGATQYEQLANFLQGQGGIQQQQQQAQLNVPYSDYLAAQQYPFLTTQLNNQTIATGAQAMPPSSNTTGSGTSVTTQPNNSGMGILGSVLGGLAGNTGVTSAIGTGLTSLAGLV
jgi:hypothetical protein